MQGDGCGDQTLEGGGGGEEDGRSLLSSLELPKLVQGVCVEGEMAGQYLAVWPQESSFPSLGLGPPLKWSG